MPPVPRPRDLYVASRSTHTVRLALIFFLAASGAMVACAHRVPVEGAPAAAEAAPEAPMPVLPTRLDVENHHWSDVVVSVTHGGITNRLGIVTANSRAMLAIRPSWLTQASGVILVVRAVGGGPSAHFESSLVVHGGERVELTLESGLQHSSVAVY